MASGDTFAAWAAQGNFPPAVNYARLSKFSSQMPCLLYDDDTTDESIFFIGWMPGQYDGSATLKVILAWNFLTFVGSQTCDWEVAFARIEDDVDSVDSLVFAIAQAVLATEPTATGELDYAEITFTNAQADGIQPNEAFILRVVRDVSGGTASPGDARLATVAVEEN